MFPIDNDALQQPTLVEAKFNQQLSNSPSPPLGLSQSSGMVPFSYLPIAGEVCLFVLLRNVWQATICILRSAKEINVRQSPACWVYNFTQW